MSVIRLRSHSGHMTRGFTMIEVLVALVVLSVGLLGLAGMQLTGLRNNTSAYSRSQATLMAYDIIDRMRANTAGITAGGYDTIQTKGAGANCPANTDACTTAAAGCTPAQLAAQDIYEWCQLFNATPPLLANSSGTVTRAGNTFTVSVTWPDREAADKTLSISVQP